MKGLELSEEYFFTYGKPLVENKFPELEFRIAAGLIGPGSECFGFDDEISQDHDWGPSFCIWLDGEDYHYYGESLQEEYEKLPKIFQSYGPRITSQGESFRVGVCSISSFYQRYTGLGHPPKSVSEWSKIPDESLAVCTNGRVFHDSLGKFTKWRNELLNYYPEDVRLKRMASVCLTSAQAGQYNFLRSIKRGELFAAKQAEAIFCRDIISLVFLMNREYAPFYKWMHRSVKDLEILGPFIYESIAFLLSETDNGKKIEIIEDISRRVIKYLIMEGLTNSPSDFLLDHGQIINQKIQNEKLRNNIPILK